MYKRKTIDNPLDTSVNNICPTNHVYKNPFNCDTIKLYHNHIVFYSTITDETIYKIFEFIKIIIETCDFKKLYNCVYLHIASLGGSLNSLMKFIDIKKVSFSNIELISVIEKNTSDAGVLLASLCDYRIIRKNVVCSMSIIYPETKYWNMFIQEGNIFLDFITILKTNNYKIKTDKMLKYISQNNTWNSKKMIKIGLVDEIY